MKPRRLEGILLVRGRDAAAGPYDATRRASTHMLGHLTRFRSPQALRRPATQAVSHAPVSLPDNTSAGPGFRFGSRYNGLRFLLPGRLVPVCALEGMPNGLTRSVAAGCISRIIGLRWNDAQQAVPPKWTTGFWFWPGGSVDVSPASLTLDVLFVHAGRIAKAASSSDKTQWYVYSELPGELPPAREYWLVFRFERQSVPDLEARPRSPGESRNSVKRPGSGISTWPECSWISTVPQANSPNMRAFSGRSGKASRRTSEFPLPLCSIGSGTARR